MKKKSTGERLEFYNFSDVTVEHLHRYAIANDFIKNKVVLDIASGEGYGSYILSKNASKVIGVDIDAEAVFDAQNKYNNANLSFTVGSADKIPVDSNTIDVVVSFETIEHHDKHEEMILEIKRVLKSDGILIMSSPDKEFYTDKTGQNNIFHIKELYFSDFKKLINSHFQQTSYYFQKSYNFNSVISDENNYNQIEIFSGDNLGISKNKIEPLYNIVIASENRFHMLKTSVFEGSNIKNLETKQIVKMNSFAIHNSFTFKVGKIICYPIFYLLNNKFKKWLKHRFL
ncbi:ubiquinone/menaquinone biosynthesis C-methylase UbiE [Flavobacterium sp. 28A]|uniref:class I SAM-dependent methyltransferase n=1 Tax=Flavobacterium sp. 28A TaxID=2735895 RepID=UPI00156F9CA4|nr:class I SAM-dependent methyltransferase [Flavobacterium sp. 28A]NRT15130.1 ubiquinone/menaquinone biosynthesis C-methylase UbiE [Flavobacterium sp. 28A]